MDLLIKLFTTFFKIGLFTFGGGYAMIPMIKAEVVSLNWASLTDIIDFIAVSESTPGPFAVNIATFIGAKTAGPLGSVFATLGVILPSFIVILLIARYFGNFQDNLTVKRALSGLRPAVIGLIASAGLSIMLSAFLLQESRQINLPGILIFAAAGLFYWKRPKLHPIFLILLSGALGILLFGLLPALF